MKPLGQLEAKVMACLWESTCPVTVREVLEKLQSSRDVAYTTVMTVLDNLHSKGFVAREKDGRAYRYRAVLSREQHTAGLIEDVLAQSPDRGAVLMNFVEQMSESDLAELRSALTHLERGLP